MQPKIYDKHSHNISLKDIDPHALYILEKLREHNFTAYLVGGSVRDLLLHITPKDFDISTSAKPEEIKKIFRSCILIGRRFRLAHVRAGKKFIEVSTFRAGDSDSDQLILRDNLWGSPEEDVLRRDFTINGLFYDPVNEIVIDYVDGLSDIKKKYLRTIGNPYVRFKQDPVRMIRLLKFRARLGFEIDSAALQALIECREAILQSSQARILEELLRMLESGASAPFFRLLADHYILSLLLPAVGDFLEINPDGEIFSYLEEVDKYVICPNSAPLKRPVLLCCLLFPILQHRLKSYIAFYNEIPHLGKIQSESFILIKDVFDVFFRLPKRYKIQTVSILTSQYRITPFLQKKNTYIRIPKIADFALALDFFMLRSFLEPGFQQIAQNWKLAYEKKSKYVSHKTHKHTARKK